MKPRTQTTQRLVPVLPLATRLQVILCAQPAQVLTPSERHELHVLRAERLKATQRAQRLDALERATIRITDRIAAYLAKTARRNAPRLVAMKAGGLLSYGAGK